MITSDMQLVNNYRKTASEEVVPSQTQSSSHREVRAGWSRDYRGGRTWSRDSNNWLTIQDQEMQMQAKQTATQMSWRKTQIMGTMGMHNFRQSWICWAVKMASCDSPCRTGKPTIPSFYKWPKSFPSSPITVSTSTPTNSLLDDNWFWKISG